MYLGSWQREVVGQYIVDTGKIILVEIKQTKKFDPAE